jgi:hypothetical protein
MWHDKTFTLAMGWHIGGRFIVVFALDAKRHLQCGWFFFFSCEFLCVIAHGR